MKKINSIDYGAKILGIGAIFIFVIPIICFILKQLLTIDSVLRVIGKVSIGVGILIFIGFGIHLWIELRQDRKIEQYYSSHKNMKVPMENGIYECAHCGNRQVKEEDTICGLCGVRFTSQKDITPQEILEHHRKNNERS